MKRALVVGSVGSAQRVIGEGLCWGCRVLDRAEVNSATVRCRTRVVPPRTVNEKLPTVCRRSEFGIRLRPGGMVISKQIGSQVHVERL
jgi:hypothetical protein